MLKKILLLRLCTVLPLILILGIIYLHTSTAVQVSPTAHRKILITNEAFIGGLYRETNADDPIAVFRYVFSSLDDMVTVYPTENYYYFEFPLGGAIIRGRIALFADSRDEGKVGFAYEEDYAFAHPGYKPLERELDLSAEHGIYLKKVNDFQYTISFEGRTVVFNLNDVGLTLPRKGLHRPDETFVGPSFDESGLQFYLVYNRKCRALLWMLNEDSFIPERFVRYRPRLLIGGRTEFAFYDDQDNNRKILVGVKKDNIIRNNWYDGPFDELPDNYIKAGRVELQKYIEASHPNTKGKIDKYGIFLNDRDVRFAVAPYLKYSSPQQLARKIDSLMAASGSKSNFYCRLAKGR